MDNLKIISDFYQGTVRGNVTDVTKDCLNDDVLGNCVTIALIKAALVEFGSLSSIFESYLENENGLNCSMFNGDSVSVSNEDIARVKDLSGIIPIPDSEYYNDAMKLYAIICKRVFDLRSTYSNSCIHDFINAIEYINCGFPTKRANELLGLKKTRIKKRHIKNKRSVIIYTGAHASYASYANQDILGRKFKVKGPLGLKFMKNPIGAPMPVYGAFILKR